MRKAVKRSISRFLHVLRPTITAWIARFEARELDSLEDKSRAPKTTVRKAWLPAMVEIYHLQSAIPMPAAFASGVCGAKAIPRWTVERIMALNRQVYKDIPGTKSQRPQPRPAPSPSKRQRRMRPWLIDGRMMDFELEGHRWWSLIILDGYSRTMLAGAVAPRGQLGGFDRSIPRVCAMACPRRDFDSGGTFISEAFEGVCTRLGIDHQTIVSTEGQSMNLMETHFNIQRRLYDYQFSLRTPLELEEVHQRFMEIYTPPPTRACSKRSLLPPIPLHCAGGGQGASVYPQHVRKFARALFPRTPIKLLCSPAQLPLLCGPGCPDAGVAVGEWPGTASGV